MHRRERQKDLLEAEPYDLDMLDKADHALKRRESNSSVAAFGEAPCNAVPEALRKSPLRKRKVLQSLKDIDPLFLSNLGIDISQGALALGNSRTLLRAYKNQGAMDLAIGTRQVDRRFLESTQEERALYEAVEDFIFTQYAQATGQEDAAASDDDDIRSELALDLEGMQNAFQEASL